MDQRRERLDVGAHDDDVARLQRRIVGQRVQDRVAQHLDLAAAAVAGVDLDAAVGRRQLGRGLVGVDRRLEPAEHGLASWSRGVVAVGEIVAQGDLQLARVAPPRRQGSCCS